MLEFRSEILEGSDVTGQAYEGAGDGIAELVEGGGGKVA